MYGLKNLRFGAFLRFVLCFFALHLFSDFLLFYVNIRRIVFFRTSSNIAYYLL